MYCVNLVHSRIDIFDSNHERTESLVQWHSKIKGKIPLIYDALCKATNWKKHKMPNLTRFKYHFQPSTLQDTSTMMPSLLGRTSSYGTGTRGKEP
jgi:hypothetical protein